MHELKELLQIKDLYSLYGDFKRRVIVPAIKELNKTGFFEIDFREVKKGRKVISIDFLVKYLYTRIYFKEFKEMELSHNISDNTIKNNIKSQITKKNRYRKYSTYRK
ncbi:replication initiation protein [Clostridium haemolyticum]|uniref:replication initiation protein n=1 Tax=Clostridium haemolyticum TaxID=84025 RepID=UPI0030B81415